MRILVVCNVFPWPPTSGNKLRSATSIESLSEVGDVDLFCLYDARWPERTVPSTVPVARVGTAPYPAVARPLRWRPAWAVHKGVPMEVVMRQFDKAPLLTFESWAADRYDLVWFSSAATFEWLHRPMLGPTVVDVDDLDNEKEMQRARLIWSSRLGRGRASGLRRAFATAQARLNARDWAGFQRSVAASVDRVLLSSAENVTSSGLPNAEVLVNTYKRPPSAAGKTEVGDPPVLLFPGSFDYGPNMEAAGWLVRDIAPRIRSRLPGAEVRLVGTPAPGVEALHDPPRVTVVGRVPDMVPELARADIAVVPIRYGSGTRLKILESFAHRVPVVSTTIGAEALGVTDGVHLLLADDVDTFAAACERLAADGDLRKRMVDQAERHYLDHYERSVARERIHALVRELTGTR